MKTNKIQQTKKALLDALQASLGVVTTACQKVGCDRSTFYKYVNEDEEFAEAVSELSNVSLDFAESQLFKRMQDGSDAAIIFYLKTKGKQRGYVERQEISGPGGKPIEFTGFSFLPSDDSASE